MLPSGVKVRAEIGTVQEKKQPNPTLLFPKQPLAQESLRSPLTARAATARNDDHRTPPPIPDGAYSQISYPQSR